MLRSPPEPPLAATPSRALSEELTATDIGKARVKNELRGSATDADPSWIVALGHEPHTSRPNHDHRRIVQEPWLSRLRRVASAAFSTILRFSISLSARRPLNQFDHDAFGWRSPAPAIASPSEFLVREAGATSTFDNLGLKLVERLHVLLLVAEARRQ